MRRRILFTVGGGLTFALIVAVVLVSVVRTTHASPGYTIAPQGFRSGADAKWMAGAGENGGMGLALDKTVDTSVVAAGVAQINGVKQHNLTTGSLTLSFDHEDGTYCGAGAPRFNVEVQLPDGTSQRIFLGCIYGTQSAAPATGWTTYTFTINAGQCFCVVPPANSAVTGIEIVQDEQGSTVLDRITINGTTIDTRGNTNS